MVDAVDGGGGSVSGPSSADNGGGTSSAQDFGGSVTEAQAHQDSSSPRATDNDDDHTSGSGDSNGSGGTGPVSAGVPPVNNNDDHDDDHSDQVAGNNGSGTGAVNGATTALSENQDDAQVREATFQSRTNSRMNELDTAVNDYISVRQAGQPGEAEQVAMNTAAGKLYQDTADELRQTAADAPDPNAAIEQQADVIRERVDETTPAGQFAVAVINQAEQQVISETPEQRALEVKRTQVVRAQQTVEAMQAHGAGRLPEWSEAQGEYRAAVKDLNETVLTEIGTEVASVHLDNVIAASPLPHTQAEATIVEGKVAAARQQLEAARKGQIPLDFTDQEMQTAQANVTARYQGLGLDQYFGVLGGAVTSNRDRTAAANNAPVELSVEVAQLHLGNTQAAAQATPGEDATAAVTQAEQQLADARNGVIPIHFTDEEANQAVANLSARNANLDLGDYYSAIGQQLIENRDVALQAEQTQAAVATAREQIQSRLDVFKNGDVCVAGIPQELLERDPVTAAFVSTLGANVDPSSPELSLQEQTIAKADPVALALMQEAGIRIETTEVNTTIVTINGERAQLTAEQQNMLAQNDVFGLASSLLSGAHFDIETQAAIYATMEARKSYTSEQVSSLLAAGNDKEALSVLDANIDAAFSPDERNALWSDIGEPTFNQAYFDNKVGGFLQEHGEAYEFGAYAGEWLDQNFGAMPAQAAGYLVNSFTGQVAASKVTDTMGSGLFFNEFSEVVEQTPSSAAAAAEWYTSTPGQADSFRGPHMGGFSFYSAITEHHGALFSRSIVERAETLAANNENFYGAEQIRADFDASMKDATDQQRTQITKDIFANFELHQDQILGNHFNGFTTGPDVTRWTAAENTPALRNTVGRTLGLTPTNQEAATNLDNTQDWFDSGDQQAMVDLTVRTLIQEAGPGGQIRAIPAYLAGDKVGAQNYALFEVRNVVGEISLIDGTTVANMVYINPDIFDANHQLVDNFQDQFYGDWRYSSFENFQKDNSLPDDAHIYVPEAYMQNSASALDFTGSLLTDIDGDGRRYVEQAAAITTGWERFKMVGDIAVTGVSIAAGIALALPSGGGSLAAAAAVTGLVWGGYRTWDQFDHMQNHGQSLSWSNPNARGLYIGAAGQVLAIGAMGSGAIAGRLVNSSSRFASAAFTTSRVMGAGAFGVGGYMTAQQGFMLATNADQMTGEQFFFEAANFGLGVLDMGVGAWSHNRAEMFHRLRADAEAAIVMHNETGAVPRDFGHLDFVEGGKVRFTAADGRSIDVTPAPGQVQRPNFDVQMPDLWRDAQEAMPDQRNLNFLDNGEIVYTSPDGERSFTLRAATDGPPTTLTERTIADIDQQVRANLGAVLPEGGPAARFFVVDDATFRTIHAELASTEVAVKADVPALTIENGNQGAVIVIKEGAVNDSMSGLTRNQIAHEVMKYYANPEFRAAAESIDVATDWSANSNMLEGVSEYLAWRQTEYPAWSALQEEGKATYTEFLTQQIEGIIDGNPAEWAHPVETMAAEQIVKIMGPERVYQAMFEGDPGAIAKFREVAAEVLAPAPAEGRRSTAATLAMIRDFGKSILSGHDTYDMFRANAERGSPSVEEWAAFYGFDKTYMPSNWIRDTVESLRQVGGFADLMADIHAHSRPYDRRSGDRAMSLIDKTGPFARILIGDIPQACGFSHYSNVNTTGLTLNLSRALDDANTQQFATMLGNFRQWDSLVGRVRDENVPADMAAAREQLAHDVDVAVLTAARDREGNITGSDLTAFNDLMTRVSDEISPALADELRSSAGTNPYLAVRSDLSLTGFNPGGADNVDYIRSRMLENPGAYKFLGEMTLQKEMVAVLLGDEATLLAHPKVDAFVSALGEFGRTNDTAALRDAIVQFETEPQSERVKPQIGTLREALARGNADEIAAAVRGMDTEMTRIDQHQRDTIQNFENMLAFAKETGIGVLIHCDWGEAEVSPVDGRPVATDSDYRYFDQLIEIVGRYGPSEPGGTDGANVVLAHTGIGRFVRPDQTMVDFTLPGGQTIRVPEHIARMEQALHDAPHVKFDISWNDVGEAFVKDPDMFQGLMGFIERHPDAIIFGSDTVKPVHQAQYRQASSTLMPFFAELARRDPGLLRNILRDNYTNLLGTIDDRVMTWTADHLAAGPERDAAVAQMYNDSALLARGRTLQDGLANTHFENVLANIDAVQKSPLIQPPVPPRRLDPDAWHRNETALFDVNRLGTPGPRDTENSVGDWLPTRFTSRGTPADAATYAEAGRQMAIDITRSAILTLTGAAASGTPASMAASVPSIARQFFFAARLQYREFVRLSWEAVFEDGKGTDANVRMFLDRVMKVGRAVGVEEGRLQQVVDMSLQYQQDFDYVSRIDVNENAGWTAQRKEEAISALVGIYQINVDRALGLQASSLDQMDPRLTPGRDVNKLIADSASLSMGFSTGNIFYNLLNGNAVEVAVHGLGGLADLTALGTMTAKAHLDNKGGRANVPEGERPWARWLQTFSLSGLAAGGGVRTGADIASVFTGDPVTGMLLTALDGAVTAYATRAARAEYSRVSGRGRLDPGQIARINQTLLAAIAASGVARTLIALNNGYETLEKWRTEREVEVDTIAVPTTIAPPLADTPGLPADAPAPTFTPPPAQTQQFTPPAAPDTTPLEVVPDQGLNIRSGASADSPKLGALERGSDVVPTGRDATDDQGRRWVEVTGTTPAGDVVAGWVASDYLRNKTAGSVEVVPPIGLNVRAGPTVQDTKLGTFPEGAVLHPTGTETTDANGNRWIEVTGTLTSGANVTGWISGQYVRPAEDEGASLDNGTPETAYAMTYGQPLPAAEFIRLYAH